MSAPHRTSIVIGARIQDGASQPGCLMGPDAFRIAGLPDALQTLGYQVEDRGNCALPDLSAIDASGPGIMRAETIGWTQVLADAADASARDGQPRRI